MDDSRYCNPSKIEIKFKLITSNTGAMSKYLAPLEILAEKNQTLAAAIKTVHDNKFAVERRLCWTEVEGHDGEVAVNPFSLLCRWLKPGTSVRLKTNERINYNTKEFDVVGKSHLFYVKTDDRHNLPRITDVQNKSFKGKDICVAAMEGDTIQEALERDGRFLSQKVPMFQLHYGDDRASPLLSAKASSYHNTVFSVAVK